VATPAVQRDAAAAAATAVAKTTSYFITRKGEDILLALPHFQTNLLRMTV
jgi:hypothetical protein